MRQKVVDSLKMGAVGVLLGALVVEAYVAILDFG